MLGSSACTLCIHLSLCNPIKLQRCKSLERSYRGWMLHREEPAANGKRRKEWEQGEAGEGRGIQLKKNDITCAAGEGGKIEIG
ncbi:hypothetical protein CRENBAI_001103 [Crenichthys baileyi]|uniref:Uncharacterized protein n=1 Tax=Crenichthys baileyi TaxID=28760 RepID=A0AAV9R711_9TELE